MNGNPHGYRANLQRGILLRDHGRFKEASEFFGRAIEAEPDNPRGYFEQALCFCNFGNNREALRYLDRAQALSPNEAEYLALRALIISRRAWLSRKALTLVNKALEINPTLVGALITKAIIYHTACQWKQSEAAAREVLKIEPRNDFAANLLAFSLRMQGRTKESSQVLAEILHRVPTDAFGQANAGWTALQTGDYERAYDHFLNSLRIDPHESLALTGLRQALMQRAWPYRFIFQARALFRSQKYAIRILIIFVTFSCPLILPVLGGSSLMGPLFSNLNVLMTFLLLPTFLIFTQVLARLCILSHPLIIHSATPLERVSPFIGLAVLTGYCGFMLNAGIWLPVAGAVVLLATLCWSIRRPDR
jgi:Flp pilus assembly protein TadD